jgi:hypothetical protein
MVLKYLSPRRGSLWPLQFVINELDPSIRFLPENVIVCGLWFGGDPNMEVFLKPMVTELANLKNKMIDLKISDTGKINIQLRALLCTADCPAKDKLLKKVQFNGYFGCTYCLHPGTLVEKRQVRYTNLINLEKRTHESTIADMMEVHEAKRLV